MISNNREKTMKNIQDVIELLKKMFNIGTGVSEDLEQGLEHALVDTVNMSARDISFQQALVDESITKDIMHEYTSFISMGHQSFMDYPGLGAHSIAKERMDYIIEDYFDMRSNR